LLVKNTNNGKGEFVLRYANTSLGLHSLPTKVQMSITG